LTRVEFARARAKSRCTISGMSSKTKIAAALQIAIEQAAQADRTRTAGACRLVAGEIEKMVAAMVKEALRKPSK
jgi:hypothetical protein